MALFIRIQYIRYTEIDMPIRVDALGYTNGGFNIYKNGVYSEENPSGTPNPQSVRWPGYSLFIALAFLLGGGVQDFILLFSIRRLFLAH